MPIVSILRAAHIVVKFHGCLIRCVLMHHKVSAGPLENQIHYILNSNSFLRDLNFNLAQQFDTWSICLILHISFYTTAETPNGKECQEINN